ncbi:DUF4870 domain-containing protein [Galbibacter pacificus]|uniref:DUF4870 domain-containing protein n=1 Tax=Galbibacter pacificus TaxID=2996052 RepID=A0ABT6FRD1_9FLAO|nr:DUF4870 domain-containing protein [Galbibacter pacificus]MDG3581699.1 DUF4870 domain-containing protein [Galbibacter pacificus]MDG3585827.1 DUF4870 domain-containing protein [Galbibacter pacificus]
METSISKHEKNVSTVIHLSTFSKYFIPFGNFIIPLLIWTSNKDRLSFVDENGKEAINFQISILLYSIALGIIVIPIVLFTAWEFVGFADLLEHNTHEINFNFEHLSGLGVNTLVLIVAGMAGVGLLLMDLFCTIIATLRANDGIVYRYPLSIKFIK